MSGFQSVSQSDVNSVPPLAPSSFRLKTPMQGIPPVPLLVVELVVLEAAEALVVEVPPPASVLTLEVAGAPMLPAASTTTLPPHPPARRDAPARSSGNEQTCMGCGAYQT